MRRSLSKCGYPIRSLPITLAASLRSAAAKARSTEEKSDTKRTTKSDDSSSSSRQSRTEETKDATDKSANQGDKTDASKKSAGDTREQMDRKAGDAAGKDTQKASGDKTATDTLRAAQGARHPFHDVQRVGNTVGGACAGALHIAKSASEGALVAAMERLMLGDTIPKQEIGPLLVEQRRIADELRVVEK